MSVVEVKTNSSSSNNFQLNRFHYQAFSKSNEVNKLVINRYIISKHIQFTGKIIFNVFCLIALIKILDNYYSLQYNAYIKTFLNNYEVLSESSRTTITATVSVEADAKVDQNHIPKTVL